MRLPEFFAGGAPPTLEQMRAIGRAARQSLNIDVAPPLFKTGNNLRLDTSGRSFWGKLGGITSPYDLTEVSDDGTGTGGWITRPGGVSCTACAFEANKLSSLGGQVFRIRRGQRTGEWRFLDDRYAPPCAAQLCVVPRGCCAAYLKGVTITVYDSTGAIVPHAPGVDSCVSGDPAAPGATCCWPVTPGATYTATAVPPNGSSGAPFYGTSSAGPITIKCNNNYLYIDLVEDTDHVCCVACPDGPNVPLPRTLTLDDGLGLVTLTYDPTQSLECGNAQVWTGGAARTPTCDVYEAGTDPYGNPTCLNLGRRNVPVQFTFACVPASAVNNQPAKFTLTVAYQICFSGNVCYLSDGGTLTAISAGLNQDAAGLTCDPPYFPFMVDWNPACLIDQAPGNPGILVGWDKAGCLWNRPQPMTVYA